MVCGVYGNPINIIESNNGGHTGCKLVIEIITLGMVGRWTRKTRNITGNAAPNFHLRSSRLNRFNTTHAATAAGGGLSSMQYGVYGNPININDAEYLSAVISNYKRLIV